MIGVPHVHHRATDSTNERAKDLAQSGAPHGTLVTAGEQGAGRGRQGRQWSAPPGAAVLMSLVLRELDESADLLPLAAAVAVCEAVEAQTPVECLVKWPNDVWAQGRKLAGILIEGRPQEGWAVLGIGLNVSTSAFPADLARIATSLALSAPSGPPPPVTAVLAGLLERLERRLPAPADETLAAWRERDALHGHAVRWADGQGTAAGIDETGALLVRTGSGTHALQAGEVHLQRR